MNEPTTEEPIWVYHVPCEHCSEQTAARTTGTVCPECSIPCRDLPQFGRHWSLRHTDRTAGIDTETLARVFSEQGYFDAYAVMVDHGEEVAAAYNDALAAERAAPKVDVEEVLGILAGLDGAFQWITEHYRAAMVAMPTEHYRAIGRAEHFAARLAGEEEAEHE